MPRIPPKTSLPLMNAEEAVRAQTEQANEELQAGELAASDYVAQFEADFIPGAPRRRAPARDRHALAWPLRPHGRDTGATAPRGTGTGTHRELPPLDPELEDLAPHAELLPLLHQLRQQNEAFCPVGDAALLRLGVEDHRLQHVNTTLLRRLGLALATHHRDVAFADDVRRAWGANARRDLWSAHRDIERLYAGANKLAQGGPSAAFLTSWQSVVGQLHQHANAALKADREHLPMLAGEGAVWRHCLETLRPYELPVAEAVRDGASLDPRVTLDLLSALFVMRDIFADWLEDAERKTDQAGADVGAGRPPGERT